MSAIGAFMGVCTPFEPHAVRTGAANEELLALAARQREDHRRRWEEIINAKLIEWGRNPSELEDDDLEPPSKSVIRRAIQLAQLAREARSTPPDWIIPDGDGGILFEWREGSIAVVVEILGDGSVDYATFEDNRLMSRTPIDE